MADHKHRNFIQKAIKRPGALTKLVGGAPGKNIPKVRKIAKEAGLPGVQARFFLNRLLPIIKRNRKKSILKRKA